MAETQNTETPENEGAGRGSHRRQLVGTVTSDKMNKTVVVMVTRRVKSEAYGKYMTKRVKYKAHNEQNDVHIGDRVEIVESRPLSKDKRWRVAKLIEKGTAAPAEGGKEAGAHPTAHGSMRNA